jgi:DMSO/TMAO reductase YedYZ molybdopterin-dependent catalytic subunit
MPRTKPSSLRYFLDGPPAPDAIANWKLQLSGNDIEATVTAAEIAETCELVHQTRRAVCVTNWSIAHTWDGYRLADVLRTFLGYTGDGSGVFLYQRGIGTPDKGKYDTSVDLAQSLANEALLIIGIDGAKLTLERGAPMRFLDPGLYLYKCVKSLERLELRTEPYQGAWETDKAYDFDGTVLPRRYSCIDIDSTLILDRIGEQAVDPLSSAT